MSHKTRSRNDLIAYLHTGGWWLMHFILINLNSMAGNALKIFVGRAALAVKHAWLSVTEKLTHFRKSVKAQKVRHIYTHQLKRTDPVTRVGLPITSQQVVLILNWTLLVRSHLRSDVAAHLCKRNWAERWLSHTGHIFWSMCLSVDSETPPRQS